MWFILFNRVWKLYLKRKRQFSLFCDSLPVWEKSYFWDRKLPGGVFWRHLQKESTWYLLRRDRGEVTPSWQTDRQTDRQTVSFNNIRCTFDLLKLEVWTPNMTNSQWGQPVSLVSCVCGRWVSREVRARRMCLLCSVYTQFSHTWLLEIDSLTNLQMTFIW